MSSSINAYEKKRRSQNGEDGIISELFARIGTVNHYFVEFGVQSGIECNAAYPAMDQGWSGLLIEANEGDYTDLKNTYFPYPAVTTAHHFVTRENIVGLFKQHEVPVEFDLLSIDIDGNDYWIWQALADYRPRLVVIEYNYSYPPPLEFVVEYDPGFGWDLTTYYGASLTSLAKLGQTLGYALIGTESTGVNAFFVRRDLLELSGFSELTPEEAFHDLTGHPKYKER